MAKVETYGLILAGGKSARMGRDKFLIEFHGEPQYLFLNKLLAQHCEKVFLSCNKAQLASIKSDISTIIDNVDYKGPLSAIKLAFSKHQVNWLIVPCDMPNIDDELISQLSTGKRDFKVKCVVDESHRINPLLALYTSENSNEIIKYEGNSATNYVKSVEYETVQLSRSQGLNINTEEQLQEYLKDQG